MDVMAQGVEKHKRHLTIHMTEKNGEVAKTAINFFFLQILIRNFSINIKREILRISYENNAHLGSSLGAASF